MPANASSPSMSTRDGPGLVNSAAAPLGRMSRQYPPESAFSVQRARVATFSAG